MKVKAIAVGYYGLRRIREGQSFLLQDPKHFSKKWMERDEDEDSEESEGSAPNKPSGKKPKPSKKVAEKSPEEPAI